MADYLIGNPALALTLAVVVACGIALFWSVVLNWASGKSPLWNIGFAVAIVIIGAVALLAAVIITLGSLVL